MCLEEQTKSPSKETEQVLNSKPPPTEDRKKEEIKEEKDDQNTDIKANALTEVLYLILIYEKTIRIKVITIQNTIPKFCELLDELEIDTQNYHRNVTQPAIQSFRLLDKVSSANEKMKKYSEESKKELKNKSKEFFTTLA